MTERAQRRGRAIAMTAAEVDEFLATVVAPIRARYAEARAATGTVTV